MIHGYKALYHPMQTRFGQTLEVGKKYSVTGEIKFGSNGHGYGNGYHFCKSIANVFRYCPFDDGREIDVCEVIGSGEIVEYEDEYNAYYDMYAASELEIVKLLSRDEILKLAYELDSIHIINFIKTFPLVSDEIPYFEEKFKNYISVLQHIKYYQLHDVNAFDNQYYTKQKKE